MRPATRPVSRPAPVFAALGDPTRLRLVERLRSGGPQSIATLTGGGAITRQAVTKHLRVLAEAGLVRDARHGREHVWSLNPEPLRAVDAWLDQYRALWDENLDRLEAYLAELQDPNAQRPPEDKS